MFRVPIATRSRLTRIIGRPTVQAVEIENLDGGERRVINCDTVVFTGDWIPDHELARSAGIEIDPATKGPLVDTALHTSRQGVFATGNVLHPVDTADIAALDGMFVADEVHRCLSSPAKATTPVLRLKPDPPCAGWRLVCCRPTPLVCHADDCWHGPTTWCVFPKSLSPKADA